MSKAIKSYPKSERAGVIERRLRGSTKGLGYISAVEAKAKGATVSTENKSEVSEIELPLDKQE